MPPSLKGREVAPQTPVVEWRLTSILDEAVGFLVPRDTTGQAALDAMKISTTDPRFNAAGAQPVSC